MKSNKAEIQNNKFMTQVNKYKTYRGIACLLISITTIILMGFFGAKFENDILAIIIMCTIGFIGCLLINLAYKICDKKIERYKKDNAEQLSLDSSQL